MTQAKLQPGQDTGKRRVTIIELLLIAPFFLFLLYSSTESILLPVGAMPRPQPARAEIQASVTVVTNESAAPAQDPHPAEPRTVASTLVESNKPSVVTAGTTVLQRIAPVASVTLEAPTEVAVAPATEVPVSVETAKPESAAVPPPEVAQAAPVAAPTPPQAAALRLEISDGTGVDLFAKNVAQTLEQSGFALAAVSTMPSRTQRRTVILYRDGFEQEAHRLSKLFSTAPALVNNTRSRNASDTSDVRLVLGSMAAKEKALFASAGASKM